jgi:hypothetical protein
MKPSPHQVASLAIIFSVVVVSAARQIAFPAKKVQMPMHNGKKLKKPIHDDIELIDDYLATWDRFALGENSLVPDLNREAPAFKAALGRALRAQDKRAPARLVFFAVVQVGGAIPVESELGKDAAKLLGPNFPTVNAKVGSAYFASDLYFWWLEHQTQYEAFPLLDEWARRDFATKKVIPKYQRLRQDRKRSTKAIANG